MLARLAKGEPYRTWVQVAPGQWVERKRLHGLKSLPPGTFTTMAPAGWFHRPGAKHSGYWLVKAPRSRYVLVTRDTGKLLTKPAKA